MSISGSHSGTTTPANPITLDSGLWSSFANAKGDQAFLTSWLALLITKVPTATLGVIMQADPEAGAFVPVAIAPDPRRDLGIFREVAEKVLGSNRPANLPIPETDRVAVAYPVQIEGGPVSRVIALELQGATKAQSQTAIREMHWAAGWLASKAWGEHAAEQSGQVARAAIALDLLALAGEHKRPEPAAMAIVNALQPMMACDQISIGMIIKRHTSPRIKLMAMSYSAWFKKRSTVAESLETTMEEAFDQNGTVAVPSLPSISRAISVAHQDHVKATRTQHILSTPLQEHSGPVGVITIERRTDTPFTEDDRRTLESVAALVGPVLELKRKTHRWLGGRIWDTLVHALGVVLGPRRLSWKLLTLGIALLAVLAATVQGPFRIRADGVLRGEVLRAAVAPFNGFVDTADFRAGDTVEEGAVLARLDATDLRLEELRWRSELDRLDAQQRDALAQYERSQVAFLEAQIAQARAQLALTSTQLARTEIISPIAGVVVNGDLSQKLGAPVQPGEVLFEVAPLEGFRVDIYVDERDLRWVQEAQTGHLALAGRPDEGLDFTVTRITPVAEPREGINTFRVEATLEAPLTGLRPGMEGVAKIDAGEALIVWTWTRRLVNWARETAWTWQP